jgi:electron transfer DM13
MPAPAESARPTPLAVKVAALVVVPAVLLLGLWLVSGRIASGYWTSIAFGAAWFVLASVVLGKLTKGRPDLRRFTRPAFALTAIAVSLAFYWTSIRETTVDEDVVAGVPASRAMAPATSAPDGGEPTAAAMPAMNVQVAAGAVEAVGHSAKGRAALVRLARGGHVLTLTDFDIDPGPMIEVRLVAGTDDAATDHVLLGDLKGTHGDQQYRLPAGADLERHRRVVFWCVPFSQSLARADLRPS